MIGLGNLAVRRGERDDDIFELGGATAKPFPRRLMSDIVVHFEVHFELFRNCGVDLLEESRNAVARWRYRHFPITV